MWEVQPSDLSAEGLEGTDESKGVRLLEELSTRDMLGVFALNWATNQVRPVCEIN